jgi:carboxynorspermidine decarboxylase
MHLTSPLAVVIQTVETPAFVIDERSLIRDLKLAASLRAACGFKLLYAIKPLTFEFVLELMANWVDGFATSSLFESRLARGVIGQRGTVHITTPGYRVDELGELSLLCNSLTFNSVSQLRRLVGLVEQVSAIGLRINPQLSLVDDRRYDPCRRYSKLGVPAKRLHRLWKQQPKLFKQVAGLQFHTNCDSTSFKPLYRTVLHLMKTLDGPLSRVQWINLGGGYLFNPQARIDLLGESVYLFRSRYGLDVFIEPGAGLVRRAGYLVSTVVDLFRVDGKSVAVLDTTVNHFPEVFEYQFEPDVLGHHESGRYEYQLAGSSCLAGDVIGDYVFHQPLHIGSRVVLTNVGAYAMVKAHMFNGINLPTVYSVTSAAELILRRRFTYQDFISRFGVCRDAAL